MFDCQEIKMMNAFISCLCLGIDNFLSMAYNLEFLLHVSMTLRFYRLLFKNLIFIVIHKYLLNLLGFLHQVQSINASITY